MPSATDLTENEFLERVALRLRLRPEGFRRNLGQVFKRIRRRASVLGVGSLADYLTYAEAHADEWPVLDALCRVTISRFYRDAAVFDRMVARAPR